MYKTRCYRTISFFLVAKLSPICASLSRYPDVILLPRSVVLAPARSIQPWRGACCILLSQYACIEKEATMCGGVRFKYDQRLEPALSEIYTTEQLDRARSQGFVESVFWQERPILPVLFDNELR